MRVTIKDGTKRNEQGNDFVKCKSCGNKTFLAGTSAVEIVKFPENDPTEFENVTNKDHSIDYVQCDGCGEELDLHAIGFYG